MKLADREQVDGTRVVIGRRVRTRDGHEVVSRVYIAQYRIPGGRQVRESLHTADRRRPRRKAIELQQRLERGERRPAAGRLLIAELVERYSAMTETKGVAPKTVAKYRADLDKFTQYCEEKAIKLASRFDEDALLAYRQWLTDKGYAAKTVQGAVFLAKQVFKWAWKRKLLHDYALAGVTLPKAKAKPQPCFTSAQVESLIAAADGQEKTAFALMAYAGLRIGEVEQLRWEDVRLHDGEPAMLHIRRGGSNGSTKDKDDRFIPIHPSITRRLPRRRSAGPVLEQITERSLLGRLKKLCKQLGFRNPQQYKLHTFRHFFASLCANHQVAYKKALAWLGHSSSEMLDLYYHLSDDDSRQAMRALAQDAVRAETAERFEKENEAHLRPPGEPTNEKPPQAPKIKELTAAFAGQTEETERGGFDRARFSKLCKKLHLTLNSRDDKEFERLVRLLR